MTYDRKESALEASVRAQQTDEHDSKGSRLQSEMVERPGGKKSELLSAALNPSSIAVVGASDNPNKIGGRPLLTIKA